MAKRFVFVTEDLWTDAKFLRLSTDARVLFMWSWMPPHSAVCGLYNVTPNELGHALGASQRDGDVGRLGRVQETLSELEYAGMLRYDWAAHVLWVVNRVRYAANSPKAINYMQREVRRVHNSPLVDEFLSRYGEVLQIDRME